MNWIKWPLVILGFMYLFSRKWMPPLPVKKQPQPTDETQAPSSKAEEALLSGDIELMTAALSTSLNNQEKEALLSAIIAKTYPLRKDPKTKEVFYTHAEIYIKEFSHFIDDLKKASGEEVPVVAPFRMLAIALSEDGREEDALDVCRQALDYGVEDGTKTGFKGRMTRLQKKIDSR
jgi:hypothetical protein